MILFISEQMDEACEYMLAEKLQDDNGTRPEVLRLPPFSAFSAPVASHPDMLLFPTCDGVICPRAYYEEHRALLHGCGVPLIPVETPSPSESGFCEYPYDITLNALPMISGTKGEVLFCHRRCSEKIKSLYAEGNIAYIKQGYARCSVCSVNHNAAITADRGEAAAIDSFGIDTLLISAGGISLPGYDTGFIGGASAYLDGKLFFFGDPMTHADGEAIMSFAHDRIGHDRVFVCEGKLRDYGSAFIWK